MAVITVTSVQDTLLPDDGLTLREALEISNETLLVDALTAAERALVRGEVGSGRNTIAFNISGTGPFSIRPLTPLPAITQAVEIDGYTQPGSAVNTGGAAWNGVIRIELDGSAAGSTSGLRLEVGESVICGLAINRFRNDELLSEHGNAIALLFGGGNRIEGNLLGTDLAGQARHANENAGVYIAAGSVGNTIGGSTPAARNVLSGNDHFGVWIRRSAGNLVQGNLIGTDRSGAAALGNGGAGVLIDDSDPASAPNQIGGATTGSGNVISGNLGFGVFLQGGGGTLVEGNKIGSDVTGLQPLGNDTGIVANQGSSRNVLGGATASAANLIAYHAFSAVDLTDAGVGNAVLGNSIFANNFENPFSLFNAGIDLGPLGPTANDPGDADTGPNQLQNTPQLLHATKSGGNLKVTYTVPSTSQNSTYPLRVELFLADDSGQQGKTFFAADQFTALDASGAMRTALLPVTKPLIVNSQLVATATDSSGHPGLSGNTSEFSASQTLLGAWHNWRRSLDVNDDTRLTAVDALNVINYLNAVGASNVPELAENVRPYIDTNTDDRVTASDALSVINAINAGFTYPVNPSESATWSGTLTAGELASGELAHGKLAAVDWLYALAAEDSVPWRPRRRL